MRIILNENRQDAADELVQLLTIAARALDPVNNHSQLELTNKEAVALASFLDEIAKAVPQLCLR